jgi:hypothetical protein
MVAHEQSPCAARGRQGCMIRLDLLGADTHLHSSLCCRCPQGRAGCCASPPAIAWADIGRIVSLGGRDWLFDQMQEGNLIPGTRGLVIRRAEASEDEAGRWPRRCIYLGPIGCTIPAERRSATCNYYLCDDAFVHGEGATARSVVSSARRAHGTLTDFFGRLDLLIAERIEQHFGTPPWDEAFLEWLGREYRHLVEERRETLVRLERGEAHHRGIR